jgi:homoserine O-acetyltransferase
MIATSPISPTIRAAEIDDGCRTRATSQSFDADFQESYLRYRAASSSRFDANSFCTSPRRATITIGRAEGSAVRAWSKARAKFLVISFTSDWLYPTYQAREIVKGLKKNGRDVSFCEIEAEWGHDAFLIPSERLKALIHGFLDRIYHEIDQ